MAIKKKTKAQKAQDVKDLAKAQMQLLKKVKTFEQEVWECQWDLDYVRVKDIKDVFKKAREAQYIVDRCLKTHTFAEYKDIEKLEDRNYSHIDYYK